MKLINFILLFVCSQKSTKEHVEEHFDTNTRRLSTLGAYSWRPIRIFDQWMGTPDPDQQAYVNQILSISQAYLGRSVLVRQVLNSSIIFGNPSTCQKESIDEILSQQSYPYDLVIYVRIVNDSKSNQLVTGLPCKFSSFDSRPIFGTLVWNNHYNSSTNYDVDYANQIVAILHEMIHILGFVQELYPKYYDVVTLEQYSNITQTDDFEHLILSTPRLVNFTQTAFQVFNLTGAIMENGGDETIKNQHFERTAYMNDFMTGNQLPGKQYISGHAFTLLADTGFYRLARFDNESTTWALNGNYLLFQGNCDIWNFHEPFCDPRHNQKYNCSYDNVGIGICQTDSLSDGCYYISLLKGVDCRGPFSNQQHNAPLSSYLQSSTQQFGDYSQCIHGSADYSYNQNDRFYIAFDISCLQIFQDQVTGLPYAIVHNATITPDNQQLTINKQDDDQFNIQYNFTNQFKITNAFSCKDTCNRNGICVMNKCTCAPGYAGAYCDQTCNTLRTEDNICVNTCLENQFQDSITKYCITCSANCMNCTYIDKCTNCHSGYWLNSDAFCDPLIVNYSYDQILYYSVFLIYIMN